MGRDIVEHKFHR